MEDVLGALKKVGVGLSMVVGNIAEFFLGPLTKFLLRLGLPYLILLGIALVASVAFHFTGFIIMVSPLSIIIAIAIIAIFMLMAILFRKGGRTYDTNE